MRYLVVISGIWSLLMGQQSGLQWVELADTVYGIMRVQDTFRLYIQSRTGNVRRFERYDYWGGVRTLGGYDSVYLDASGRIDRIRSYQRDPGTNNITFRAQYQFSYPNPPAIKVEVTEGGSSSPVREVLYYGLRRLEGSFVWGLLEDDINIPIEPYPRQYLIDQIGDSIVSISRVSSLARAFVRKARPGDCDTIIGYFGPANGPLNPAPFGKICRTGGRIDSVIILASDEQEYWTYDANGRPVQKISVRGSSERDTVRYIYDGYGRLSEVWRSGVRSFGPHADRFFFRYQGIPSSLAFEVERGCLSWDAASRRGWFRCKGAGDVTVVQAYDIQGRLVWEGRVEGNSMFELPASLPAGLYHLRAGVQGMKVYLLP